MTDRPPPTLKYECQYCGAVVWRWQKPKMRADGKRQRVYCDPLCARLGHCADATEDSDKYTNAPYLRDVPVASPQEARCIAEVDDRTQREDYVFGTRVPGEDVADMIVATRRGRVLHARWLYWRKTGDLPTTGE